MRYLNKKFNIKIVFIFSFIGILFFYQNIQKQMEDNIFNIVEKLTAESSENIDVDIQNKFNLLDTVAYNISDEDLSDPQKLAESFSEIVKKNKLKRMAIATPDGKAYFDNGDTDNISNRDYFKASIDGERYISKIFNLKIDGKRSNVFSIPIYRDKNIVAILFSYISTDEFYEEFSLGIMKELGDTFIINTDGDIISSHKNSRFNSDNFNMFDLLRNEGIGTEEKYFDYNTKGYVELSFLGKNYILCYSKLNYSNWWAINLIDNNIIKIYYSNIVQDIIILIVLIILFMTAGFSIIFNKEKRKFDNLKEMAYTDSVTKGNNDTYIKHNIYNIINDKNKFAFISLEIINIKNIATISGLNNTKFILNEVYKYLQEMLNEDEIVTHGYLGEYKLILRYNEIKELTERLENINFYNINENIKFIMGVYLVDNTNVSYEDMCSHVVIAKEVLNNNNNENNRNNKYIIYNKKMHKKESDKLKLEEDIKSGIENKEFKAWFQPKYGKDGKTIIGAEALVRWHKYGSIISPYIFIPICEANGLIKEIDELVFQDVCKNIRKWSKSNKKLVPISVNLSRSYIDKVDFVDSIEKYIDKYKITKDLINFEITESSLMGNEEKLKDVVALLHEKGFKVSVDDFGVGYSSIRTISYVEFDTLKIDKSFVDGIGEEKWESIIKYTIDLAKKLGMDVVAEGIESKEQYEFLLECNCDKFQGYYFNKPMDFNDFSKLI